MRRLCFWLLFVISITSLSRLVPNGERVQALDVYPSNTLSATELIAEVNSLRISNGLPPYNVHPILMQIAQAHTNYQAAIGSGTHYGADGSRPFQRALAAGYPVAGDLSRGGFFSENIVWGSGKTPAEAVSNWQGDAPHLNTMLSPNLQDVGAGVATSGGMTYYTLDAGLASGSPVSYTMPAGISTAPGPGTEIVSDFMLPVSVNTPNDSGSIYHEVQFGQTLWSIAIAYETTVEQLKKANNLQGISIFEGQKLMIKIVSTATATDNQIDKATATIGVPTSTATKVEEATMTLTPMPAAPVSTRVSGTIVFAIIASALIFAGLGTWVGMRKQT